MCLVNKSSDTGLIKSNILDTYFPKQKLPTPLWYRTINGFNQVAHRIDTPIPNEFNADTLS